MIRGRGPGRSSKRLECRCSYVCTSSAGPRPARCLAERTPRLPSFGKCTRGGGRVGQLYKKCPLTRSGSHNVVPFHAPDLLCRLSKSQTKLLKIILNHCKSWPVTGSCRCLSAYDALLSAVPCIHACTAEIFHCKSATNYSQLVLCNASFLPYSLL